MMVDIGHRTGLFTVAAQGWMTAQELAERSGLSERYVREWLGAVTAGGIVEYDPTSDTYRLPPEHAVVLSGPMNMVLLALRERVTIREQNIVDLDDIARYDCIWLPTFFLSEDVLRTARQPLCARFRNPD